MDATASADVGGVEAGRVHSEGGGDGLQCGRTGAPNPSFASFDHGERHVGRASQVGLGHASGPSASGDALPDVVGHVRNVP